MMTTMESVWVKNIIKILHYRIIHKYHIIHTYIMLCIIRYPTGIGYSVQ
jgi:hypothetical protein